MPRPDSDSSAADLDPLFRRLREEPAPPAVLQTALGLPTRVAARLREGEDSPLAAAYRRWALGLAPLTIACVAWAILNLNELKTSAFVDPQATGWLLLLLG